MEWNAMRNVRVGGWYFTANENESLHDEFKLEKKERVKGLC